MATVASQREPREQQAAQAARELILFCDGLEEAGQTPVYVHRARHIAHETLWLVDELETERSARRAIQEARDRLLAMVTE